MQIKKSGLHKLNAQYISASTTSKTYKFPFAYLAFLYGKADNSPHKYVTSDCIVINSTLLAIRETRVVSIHLSAIWNKLSGLIGSPDYPDFKKRKPSIKIIPVTVSCLKVFFSVFCHALKSEHFNLISELFNNSKKKTCTGVKKYN